MGTFIVEGTDLNELKNYENELQPGERGRILLGVDVYPDQATLAAIQDSILDNGADLTSPVRYDSSQSAIVIDFQKPRSEGLAGPQVAVMPAIIGGLGILTIIGVTVFAWQFFKSAGSNPAVPFGIMIGILLFIMFVRSQEGKATVKFAADSATRMTSAVGKSALKIAETRYGVAPTPAAKQQTESGPRITYGSQYGQTGPAPNDQGEQSY